MISDDTLETDGDSKYMAKIYGDRWRVVESLSRGGQGEVFKVVDKTNDLSGEYALKRILNPARHSRIVSEIEAIKRLKHPNIIELIDHSALDAADPSEKQYIVMPLASGGDLSKNTRLAYYRNSIDGVLQVAIQIASALDAAHSGGVIHRDVKPQNILFSGNGHDAWLADFGICLISDVDRSTPDGEVVGPRSFMAPELEGGGRLDVSPSVDIYALGKVVYFMLSGGVIIPREEIGGAEYSKIFDAGGERHRMLQLLLLRMIARDSSRVQEMSEVIADLERIKDWELRAHDSSMGRGARNLLAQYQKETIAAQRVVEENEAARELEEKNLEIVRVSVMDSLQYELVKVAQDIDAEGIDATFNRAPLFAPGDVRISLPAAGVLKAIDGMTLRVSNSVVQPGLEHGLVFYLCQRFKVGFRVEISSGHRIYGDQRPAEDLELVMVAMYYQKRGNLPPTAVSVYGHLLPTRLFGVIQNGDPAVTGDFASKRFRWTRISKTYYPDKSLGWHFKLSEWPGSADSLRDLVASSVESFLNVLVDSAVGPLAITP